MGNSLTFGEFIDKFAETYPSLKGDACAPYLMFVVNNLWTNKG
jgi:hypothetical protein